MQKSTIYKISLIVLLIVATFLYAVWEKEKYSSHEDNSSASLVLKQLPSFNAYTLDNQKFSINAAGIGATKGVFVHLWGTWCGPCEQEMPQFLAYAENVKSKGIKFYLIAVGDEPNNVKKFLRKFPTIPENVTIALDLDNTVMDLFGTLKVPETFLFNSKGKHVNKFVGPQAWTQESYISRLDVWLNTKN
jgi:thiol-disulfide isomerase/thioredoxin